MQSAVTNPPRFFASLESLRGGAAVIVALYHVSWQTHFTSLGLVRNASLMVDLFFVLSGFVMMHSYGGRLAAGLTWRRFAAARLARLYPLHIVTLLAFLAIEIAKWGAVHFHLASIASAPFGENTLAALIGNLLLIHSLGFWSAPAWNVPSWSISTEFYTYLLFAFICRIPRIALSAAILATAGFALSWTLVGDLSSTAKYGFARCILGFFSGVIAWHIHRKIAKTAPPIAAIAITIAAACFASFTAQGHADFLAIPVFMTLVIVCALTEAPPPRALTWLGAVSYSVYLVHPVIIWCFETLLQHIWKTPRETYYATGLWQGDALAAAYIAIVLAVSQFTYTQVERRFRA